MLHNLALLKTTYTIACGRICTAHTKIDCLRSPEIYVNLLYKEYNFARNITFDAWLKENRISGKQLIKRRSEDSNKQIL